MFKNIHLNKKTVLITAGIICGVLAAVYIGFSVFFMNHFFFRTTINGMPVAGCTADKVEKNAEESVKGYALIKGRVRRKYGKAFKETEWVCMDCQAF